MNDAGQKNIKVKTEEWENELWSLISSSNGINCSLRTSCRYKDDRNICLSRNKSYIESLNKYLDNDFLKGPPPNKTLSRFTDCINTIKLFVLVKQLAIKYAYKKDPMEIPVPIDITEICTDQPIEVRMVPLKSAHGAVWRLKDVWVIHLNSKDSSARRRFTLYHEVFHVLAHCNASPVFNKGSDSREGNFNEMLADFFSGLMILPEEIMRKKWSEVRDIKKMAVIFDVPEPVMYFGLKYFKLI